MAFTSWAQELADFKNAIANMTASQLIQRGYTNGNGETVTFRTLEDMDSHLERLQTLATAEANEGGRRRTMFVVGNGGTQ